MRAFCRPLPSRMWVRGDENGRQGRAQPMEVARTHLASRIALAATRHPFAPAKEAALAFLGQSSVISCSRCRFAALAEQPSAKRHSQTR